MYNVKLRNSSAHKSFYIFNFPFFILPARWWAQDAAHRNQRSICFPPTATAHQQTENGGIVPNAAHRCNRRQNFGNGAQNKIYGMFRFLKGFTAFIPQ